MKGIERLKGFDHFFSLICPCSAATESMVRSYTRSFNAFAARLSDEEQQKIASKCFVIYFVVVFCDVN